MAEWIDWYDKLGQIQRLARAYVDEEATDRPGSPSAALRGYLRVVKREPDATSAAVAVAQIRALLDDWETQWAREALHRITFPKPSTNRTIREWLTDVAVLLEDAVEHGNWPPVSQPITRFEWITSYRDLHEVVAGAFHQDALRFHDSLDDSLVETLSLMSVPGLARVVGQIHEIACLDHSEQALAAGIRSLGAEHSPPLGRTYQQWLEEIACASRDELARRRSNTQPQ